MGIEVQLRKENGDVLDDGGDEVSFGRASLKAFAGTRLLKYLVPWGDAIFNQAQADDLLKDIYQVKTGNPGTPLYEMLSKLEPLVEKLSRETHLYLWFVGD